MAKFYDPITECWFDMPSVPEISRPKRPTEAQELEARIKRNHRISEHKHVWDAIESTAAATQTATKCPAGSELDASES